MSVRRKILLVFGAAFLATGLLLYLIGGRVLLQGYTQIEQDLVRDGVGRATNGVEVGLQSLGSTCADWAGWNDTRDFILGSGTTYIEDNLSSPTVLTTINVNFMAFYGASNKLQHVICTEIGGDTFVEPPAGLAEALDAATVIFEHAAPNHTKTGLLNLSGGAVFLAACPVTNNDRTLPFHGTLVMGRFLNAAETTRLAEHIRQDVTIQRMNEPGAETLMDQLRPEGIEGGAVAILERDENTISGFATLPDLMGNPLLLLGVHFPRTVVHQGNVTTNVFGGVLLGVGVFTMLILLLFLEFVVLRPLNALAAHVRRIQEHKDLSLHLEPHSRDEVGALTSGFNELVDSLRTAQSQLEEVHRRLIDTARVAGMSEVASGVLHNVGNVMNSVNVTALTLKRQLESSKAPNLRKAAEMLQAHETDLGTFLTSDEKGRKLPEYLSGLSRHLNVEHDEALQICEQLMNHIRHTIEIITLQQSYARNVCLIELVAIDGLIEDAIAMNTGGLDRHGIQLVRDFQPLPPLPCDRHRLVQILVNLLSNARHAVCASESVEKIITVGLRKIGTNTIQIDVIDTGIGIEEENLASVFAYGFTTREDGHGIGLHSSALAAQELGGTLTAHSEGLGKGTMFRLELPCEQKDSAT